MNARQQTALAPLGLLRTGREAAAQHKALRLERQQCQLYVRGGYAHRAGDVCGSRRTQPFEPGANELDQGLVAFPRAHELFRHARHGSNRCIRKHGLKLGQAFDGHP